MGADEAEKVTVVEDSFNDRKQQVSGEKEISAGTKFTYPGRNGVYSEEQWNYLDFNGTYWDEEKKQSGLFRINNKTWNGETDWGKWYLDMTGADGFRLDAVKHISHEFFPV